MKTLLIIFSFFSVFSYLEVSSQPLNDLPSPQQIPLINVQADLNNMYYMPDGEKQFIYLYVTAQAAKYPDRDRNTPLNLSLVLDRSGSMSGAKLKYAREASKVVIDHLDENDQLSIIAYDHEIEVMQSSLSISSNRTRKQLKRKIDAIYDNGSTNLGGGMLEGFNQVSKHYEEEYVNRVLLLSDGLANRGITDPNALQDTAQYFNRHQNVSLSTFGLGADFDEDLMEGLSEHGGANYYFIDKAVKVTNILLQELKILQHIVSQKEKLQVNFPQNILHLEEAYGLPIQEKKGVITVPFSNMFAEEKKSVLLKFLVAKSFKKPLDISATFSYQSLFNLPIGDKAVEWKKKLRISPTHDVQQNKTHQNKSIYQQIALYEGNAAFRKAIEAVDNAKIAVAKKLLQNNLNYLRQQIINFEESPTLLQLQSYNQTYLSHLDKFENYSNHEQKILQKATKNEYYRLLKKKGID